MTSRIIPYAVRDRIATITLDRPERLSADHRTRCSWFPAVPKPIIAMARVVGHAHALDFLLSGGTLDGHEALRIGLVRQIHPRERLAKATCAYAAKMATRCPPRR
jgi:enoyl-CoA hydratase/carnithine racemase